MNRGIWSASAPSETGCGSTRWPHTHLAAGGRRVDRGDDSSSGALLERALDPQVPGISMPSSTSARDRGPFVSS